MRPGRLPVPDRPPEPPWRRRTDHRRLGPLVQQRPTHAPPRPPTTGRVRSALLCQHQRRPPGLAHVTECARNPGRFTSTCTLRLESPVGSGLAVDMLFGVPLRVAVAEDSLLVREGVRLLLVEERTW